MAAVDPESLERALARVGDRWTLRVVNALLPGALPFNDLQAAVTGISPNVLSQRLKQLERERLVVARAYTERPTRFVYELTLRGRELAGVLRLLAQWGAVEDDATLRHATCGTALEARWWCPTCAGYANADEAEELGFA